MSTVTPKLLHCEKQARDIPVWEIVTEKGGHIYYERVHHPGYRPIGLIDTFSMGSTKLDVVGVVTQRQNAPVTVLKEKEGYVAPPSWYEPIPGHAAQRQHRSVDEYDVGTSESESDSDKDEAVHYYAARSAANYLV